MPKPVKKATKKAVKKATSKKTAGTLPVPPKPKRPSDPMKAARAIMDEHMGRTNEATTQPDQSFEEQFRKRMSELGRQGGKIGGKRRMETMTPEQRSAVASKAARAMWDRKAASGALKKNP